ncbi:hypothetical protein AWC03_09835 [Mycobacterium europaeum]|uniref:hypothetical protein n=1 Tax=Mycobacterium europaeum TaxID=761804 RepID=UPI000A1549F7|nr:hypothetical protein [Mycobacterium europaeum]ORV61489.1 hypothetical protein AWC03_09835 [Mycobacterium europaeum]
MSQDDRMYQAMHSGAWLPPSAWTDGDAWDRLIDWAHDHLAETFDLRLIVTPQLQNRLGNPEGLRILTEGAERQNARGDGTSNWRPGDGPIIIVWPQEPTVRKWEQAVAGLNRQRIILLEEGGPGFPSFHGWASAVGAFNAATGDYEQPIPELDEQLNTIFSRYENELTGAPNATTYGVTHGLLREKLKAVAAGGYDEDFIVTYAIGLGYPGDLPRLRQHYAAARGA